MAWYTVQSDKCDIWSKAHCTAVCVISVWGIHEPLRITLTPYYADLFNSILSRSGLLHHVSMSRLLDTMSLWWHKLMTAFATLLLVNICLVIKDVCNVNYYMTLGFCALMIVPSMILTITWLKFACWVHLSSVVALLLSDEHTVQDDKWFEENCYSTTAFYVLCVCVCLLLLFCQWPLTIHKKKINLEPVYTLLQFANQNMIHYILTNNVMNSL